MLEGCFGEKWDSLDWDYNHKSKLTLHHQFHEENNKNISDIVDESSVRESFGFI